jgi:purine nucleosidase
VWIGGPPYGDTLPAYEREFNLRNDVDAANVVFASALQVWQVPMSTYVMMGVGYAELREKVAPCGEIGKYLVDQLIDWKSHHHHRHGSMEHHSLADTPAIGLMMSPDSAVWRRQGPVRFTHDCECVPAETGARLRVAESVDSRLFLEDFFAKLRDFAAHSARGRPQESAAP